MAAAKYTTNRVIELIKEWQCEHSVSDDAMRTLLERLATVQGNSSFETTTRNMLIAYVTHATDSPVRSWRDAIGCAPAVEGSISAEEAIRRGRDDDPQA